MNLLIQKGRIGSNLKDIYIENGKIRDIAENINPPEHTEVINAGGNLIIPGLVDMFCSIGEPGYEYREDIESGSQAAAKGGFTTITYLPDTNPVIDQKTAVNYIVNNRLSDVNIYPYGSMTKGCKGAEMSEIGDMVNAGIVGITDGSASVNDSRLMFDILRYSTMFDIPVITMCNDEVLSRGGVMNRGRISTKTGLRGIPQEAEEIMVARNILLAKDIHAKLHITHVSTADSVDIVRIAKKMGIAITCDTAPHYFTLCEELVEGYNTFGKVLPPLRTQRDIQAIKAGLEDGTIDVIVSGHTPSAIDHKRLEFDRAAYGISSLETAFALSYTALVKEGLLTMEQLLQKMSEAPAKILGLQTKGKLEPGYDADLVIFDKEKTSVINGSSFSSKSKFTPYEGWEVQGMVLHTFVNGKRVYSQ